MSEANSVLFRSGNISLSWTRFRPQFASKMGTYVSRNFFLTTEFACTYVRRMYCEIFVRVIFRVIQLIPKTPMMGFVIGSHHGASLCRLIVHPAA